jgi:DNA-binding GntR family transcriptional regulator
MFDHMAALEGLCASYAARRASGEDLARLNDLQAKLVGAFEEKQPEKFYKLNTEFHDTIYAAARASYLQAETVKLRRRLAPFRMQVTYQPGRMHATLEEHQRIVSAIEAMDAAEAARAATDHVRLLGDDLTDFIAMMPPNLVEPS